MFVHLCISQIICLLCCFFFFFFKILSLYTFDFGYAISKKKKKISTFLYITHTPFKDDNNRKKFQLLSYGDYLHRYVWLYKALFFFHCVPVSMLSNQILQKLLKFLVTTHRFLQRRWRFIVEIIQLVEHIYFDFMGWLTKPYVSWLDGMLKVYKCRVQLFTHTHTHTDISPNLFHSLAPFSANIKLKKKNKNRNIPWKKKRNFF